MSYPRPFASYSKDELRRLLRLTRSGSCFSAQPVAGFGRRPPGAIPGPLCAKHLAETTGATLTVRMTMTTAEVLETPCVCRHYGVEHDWGEMGDLGGECQHKGCKCRSYKPKGTP